MQISRFIARRMAGETGGSKLSKPIVHIAVGGVAIGVALMVLSICIVTGFQREVRNKVVGFGSHLQIVNNDNNYSKETSRIEIQQPFYPGLAEKEGVRHVQVFATKPGILETATDLQGVIIKGVGSDFDWQFFGDNLVAGDTLATYTGGRSPDLLISSSIAKRMELELDDKVTLYFVLMEGDIRPRNFKVTGIYDTGLKEFDDQFVFVDIGHIQRINQWGIEAQLRVSNCFNDTLEVEAYGFGGQRDLRYEWPGTDLKGKGPHLISPRSDTSFTVVVSDRGRTLPDTATVWLNYAHPDSIPCDYRLDRTETGGTHQFYTGGFEVTIDDYEQLWNMDDEVFYEVPYFLQTINVVDRNPEIFSWLEMLDLNVVLIIGLMILIAVVNMTSALLIIILERTNMIGLLKAFGLSDAGVMWIFIRHAGRIIGRGMVIGNIIGFGIALLQLSTSFISLDPESYYVDSVPIRFDWFYLIGIEVFTFTACALFMIFPAWYVARITPAKAIRFD